MKNNEENQIIKKISLDEKSVIRRNPEIEMERHRALSDLLSHSFFKPSGDFSGPYHLHMFIEDRRLQIDISTEQDEYLTRVKLPLLPFRQIVKDYFLICESFFEAVKKAHHAKLESIDMGRRGLHNEGADLLMQQLKDKIELDKQTARQLFTLVCVLHIR